MLHTKYVPPTSCSVGPGNRNEPHNRPLAGSHRRQFYIGSATAWLLAASSILPTAGRAGAAGPPFPGTQPLEASGDMASEMVDGLHRFLDRQLAQSVAARSRHWKRDNSSREAYDRSVAPNRQRLAKIIGAVDSRLPSTAVELLATTERPAKVAESDTIEVFAVRWPVLKGVDGEGLLLVPRGRESVGDVVALGDADQSPEALCGLSGDLPRDQQFARVLAEAGYRVVVPVLIDRQATYSIAAAGARPTNQPHREFIYRQAYEMGRHLIGYEVQKVLALVDCFAHQVGEQARTISVAGYGEGGLLALYSAALDPRIDAAWVSGYFAPREAVWEEPINRNVFSLLDEFGDAKLATLIGPRPLVIEAAAVPKVDGPPKVERGSGAAPGRLATPPLAAVESEAARAAELFGGDWKPDVIASGDGNGPPASAPAIAAFLAATSAQEIHNGKPATVASGDLHWLVEPIDAQARLRRQFDQLCDFTQDLMHEAEYTRRVFWAKADRQSRSIERWRETSADYRRYFADEVIGRFDLERLPLNPRTRQIYDTPHFTGYEVLLDVFPDVIAYGILLVPKGIEPGERRPTVVCQHGLEGRPQDVADPAVDNPAYHRFAVQLAERGFVTYAPQNPYIFEDRFRSLQRKANPLKKTLFSMIVPQHEQTLDWLSSLSMVDPDRIAFYGLSYGGKSAMRIPSLVERYCLSICSADFNEWIWKNTSLRSPYSYLGTGEYEMFEFDLGNTLNYAEMAGLIAPRPFMVERGHRDGVAPDEWVAYEFAKVRLLYADLGIEDKTEIGIFDGPHTIHGQETFDFLHRHLHWPTPQPTPARRAEEAKTAAPSGK